MFNMNRMEEYVKSMLQMLDNNPHREGLKDTPRRVALAWRHWTSGYRTNIESILTEFEDGGEEYNQMVVVKDIPFYSHCEHHLTPFFGTANIAYIPDSKIVGLSKLPKLLNMYARRLQVQERLTSQVANAMWEHLNPVGCGVVIKARHLCCESRGIAMQGLYTVTSALHGEFLRTHVRQEFLNL